MQQVQQVARTQSDAILPWILYAFLILVCWTVASNPGLLVLEWGLFFGFGRNVSDITQAWNRAWTYIDIRIAVPSPCMTRCRSHSRAYLSGPPFLISSIVGIVFFHTNCTDRTVPDSRYRNSKIHTARCSILLPPPADLDGWFGRAGGIRSSHLVGEYAMLSFW